MRGRASSAATVGRLTLISRSDAEERLDRQEPAAIAWQRGGKRGGHDGSRVEDAVGVDQPCGTGHGEIDGFRRARVWCGGERQIVDDGESGVRQEKNLYSPACRGAPPW